MNYNPSTKKQKMKILFTGGGTGGHLFPIIAIAREIRKLYQADDIRLYYIGPKDKFSRDLLLMENIKIYSIVSGKIRRYFSFKNIVDVLFNIPFGFFQSFFLLLFIKPKLVFNKGGSGSAIVSFSAKILRIPIFLHESDIVPGLSNKIVSKWAKKVFISFEKTEYFNLDKTILVGNPIKKELLEGNDKAAKEIFSLMFVPTLKESRIPDGSDEVGTIGKKPIILFFGGSQGAQTINEFVLLILNDILKEYEIIHICGKKNYKKTHLESQAILNKDLKKYYHLCESLNESELKHAYKAANLIVSRAGSGSIFEISALGKPSILIPLPSAAGNHQSKNGYEYEKVGATIVIEQENLTPNFFIAKINYLFSQPKKMEEMKKSALRFSKPMAAEIIAKEIFNYLSDSHTK